MDSGDHPEQEDLLWFRRSLHKAVSPLGALALWGSCPATAEPGTGMQKEGRRGRRSTKPMGK